MKPFRSAPLAALVVFALTTAPAHALFHLWDFTEFFSNADGTVQFIEMRATSNGENVATAGQLRSQATGNVFSFPSNLPSNQTANKFMLIATAGFGALPGGVTPDYTIPANFFEPAGDTLSLFVSGFSTVDARSFTSIPTDGVMSRNYPANTLMTNSPTNFAGAAGSVNLPPPPVTTGDYNGDGTVDAADYTVWRDTVGQTVDNLGDGADGDGNGTIGQGDYDFWKARFGMVLGGSAAVVVPEPSVYSLAFCGILGALAAAPRARICSGMVR